MKTDGQKMVFNLSQSKPLIASKKAAESGYVYKPDQVKSDFAPILKKNNEKFAEWFNSRKID